MSENEKSEPSFMEMFLTPEKHAFMLRRIDSFLEEMRLEYMTLFNRPWHACRDNAEGDIELHQLAAYAMFMGTMPKGVSRPFAATLEQRRIEKEKAEVCPECGDPDCNAGKLRALFKEGIELGFVTRLSEDQAKEFEAKLREKNDAIKRAKNADLN